MTTTPNNESHFYLCTLIAATFSDTGEISSTVFSRAVRGSSIEAVTADFSRIVDKELPTDRWPVASLTIHELGQKTLMKIVEHVGALAGATSRPPIEDSLSETFVLRVPKMPEPDSFFDENQTIH